MTLSIDNMIALDPSSKLQSNRSMWTHTNATGWLPDILLIILAKLPFKLGNVRVTRYHRLTIIHSVLNLMLVKLTFLSKLRALYPSAGECHRSLKRDLSSHHLTGVGTSMLLTRLSILLETRIDWTYFSRLSDFQAPYDMILCPFGYQKDACKLRHAVRLFPHFKH